MIGICNRDHIKLEECGINTIPDLKQIEMREANRELNILTRRTRQELLRVSKYLCNAEVDNAFEEFNEDAYHEFCKHDDNKEVAVGYIANILGAPHSQENYAIYKDVEDDSDLLNEVVRQCQEKVMTPYLTQKSGYFDNATYINGSIRHFHQLVGNPQQPQKLLVCQANTQGGKTDAVIGTALSMCGHLRMPLFCLTKGNAESIDLADKLKECAVGTMVDRERVLSGKYLNLIHICLLIFYHETTSCIVISHKS